MDDNYGAPEHTSEPDGSGPESVESSDTASLGIYMLDTGRVESYNLTQGIEGC